ncbi:MAG: MBL fold metallo-hydrolase [Anaerolineaceae bacterium]|nr:MBL fold metallo-hydrolase [Anaerolineaceae bacterium]
MIITMLGTNGWFDTDFGQTMCTLIRTRDYSIILDAGYGIRRAKELIDYSKPTFLLLSHLHLDHTIGLHTLDYLKLELPLRIVVPAGEKQDFVELVRPPYTNQWTKMVPEGSLLLDTDELGDFEFPFGITSLPLQHPVPDHGYRLEIEGKTVTYLCDTGYCDNAVALASGADLVIAECGALPGSVKGPGPHMEPEICAKLAVEAGVAKMILTHFGAGSYTSIPQRMKAVDSARSIFPNLITGVDNLETVL